jgi:methylamine dehydrogenase accessory protein MauD
MPSGLWLAAYLALWLLLIVESLLLVAVVRQVGRLHSYWARNETGAGLPLGSIAPVLVGNDVFGRSMPLAFGGAQKTLIFFLSPGCSSCQVALKLVSMLNPLEDVRFVLVFGAGEIKVKLFVTTFTSEESLKDIPVLTDPDRVLTRHYQVAAVPYAVLVDEDGEIGATGLGMAENDIKAMLYRAAERRAEREEQRVEHRDSAAEAAVH